MQQPSNTGRRLTYSGWKRGRSATYRLHEEADGWELYRDGTLIKSGIASREAALDCARADESRRA